MRQFNEIVKSKFNFLRKYGYKGIQENYENIISLVGKNNRMDVIYSMVEYELTCQFVDVSKNIFTLQDGLGYLQIKEFKGLYQIADKGELEEGISYLADTVKILFTKIDISEDKNFQKIYQYRVDKNKELQEDYYFKIDIKKAEACWRNGEYTKAQELFEKHSSKLSKSQLSKLEYIRRHT